MYNFISIILLIMSGLMYLTRYYFDFLLISFYFLYVAEVFGIIYLIKNKDLNFAYRTIEDLQIEKKVLSYLFIFLNILMYVFYKFNIAYPIILVIFFFELIILTEIVLVKNELEQKQ